MASNLRNRRRVRIKCAFQGISGNTFNGTTRNLGINGAFIECQPLTGPVNLRPKINDMGMIKIYILVDGQNTSLSSRCRIVNVFPDGIDIEAQFAYIAKAELQLFQSILRN